MASSSSSEATFFRRGGDVAANLDNLEIRPGGEQLHLAPGAAGGHGQAGGKILELRIRFEAAQAAASYRAVHEHVAHIGTFGRGGEFQAVGQFGREIRLRLCTARSAWLASSATSSSLVNKPFGRLSPTLPKEAVCNLSPVVLMILSSNCNLGKAAQQRAAMRLACASARALPRVAMMMGRSDMRPKAKG